MGEESLVEIKIDDAIELIKKLDAAGCRPEFAAWCYYEDADDWRLVIAGEALDDLLKDSEASAYSKVIEALEGADVSSLSVSDLKLVRTDSPLPEALGALVKTGAGATGRSYFVDSTFGGVFIKKMVLLRSA
jgi:hypothetical protein